MRFLRKNKIEMRKGQDRLGTVLSLLCAGPCRGNIPLKRSPGRAASSGESIPLLDKISNLSFGVIGVRLFGNRFMPEGDGYLVLIIFREL